MAASRHTPRVPRIPQGHGAAPPGSDAHDDGADVGREAGRVSVGRGAKVTLLGAPGPKPDAQDTGTGTGGEAGRAAGGGARRSTGEPAAGDVLAFPEPPHRRRRRRAAIVACAAAALVAGLLAVVLFTPLVAVRTIKVQGTQMLTPGQAEGVLEPVRDRPLATVGDDEVRALLGQLVQVKDARVRAEPPETLVVTVIERVPVALVKQEGGLLVVDGEGVVLGTVADEVQSEQYDVPVIDGASVPVGQEVFRALTAVLSALPTEVLAQLATASAESADSVQLKLADGRTVIWGNAEERELKSRVLQALVKAADEAPPGQAPVRVFDVSAPRHPVTR